MARRSIVAALTFLLAACSAPADIPTPFPPTPNPTDIARFVAGTVAAMPSATPLPTLTPRPTRTPVPTWTPLPTATLWPTNTPTPTPTVAILSAQAAKDANLRAGPGTNYPIEGSVKRGQALDIVAESPRGNWYQLRGAKWISASLVQGAPEVKVAAVIPTPPPPKPTPTAGAWSIGGPIRHALPECGVEYGSFPDWTNWTEQGDNNFIVQHGGTRTVVMVRCLNSASIMETQADADLIANALKSQYGWLAAYPWEFNAHQGDQFPLTYATYHVYWSNGQSGSAYFALVELPDQKTLSILAISVPAGDLQLAAQLVGVSMGIHSLSR